MNLKLNNKKIKALSADSKSLPAQMTPQVAGGANWTDADVCHGPLTLVPKHTCGYGGPNCRPVF